MSSHSEVWAQVLRYCRAMAQRLTSSAIFTDPVYHRAMARSLVAFPIRDYRDVRVHAALALANGPMLHPVKFEGGRRGWMIGAPIADSFGIFEHAFPAVDSDEPTRQGFEFVRIVGDHFVDVPPDQPVDALGRTIALRAMSERLDLLLRDASDIENHYELAKRLHATRLDAQHILEAHRRGQQLVSMPDEVLYPGAIRVGVPSTGTWFEFGDDGRGLFYVATSHGLLVLGPEVDEEPFLTAMDIALHHASAYEHLVARVDDLDVDDLFSEDWPDGPDRP